MFYLRMAGTLAGFFAASVYGVAIALVRRDRSLVARDYASMLARLMRPALGLRTHVQGREWLTARHPCVYVANHQSMYDVPILAELYPPNTVVIGKRELRRIPFFGWLYAVTGNVFIDRSDSASAVSRLRQASEAIAQRGVSAWIFPEGTRATEPGRLLPFKKGAFHMAVDSEVPIVPIVVEPVRPFFDAERRRIRPGVVNVRVLEPIETAGLREGDVPALIERTRGAMQEALTSLAAERTGAPALSGPE